MCPIFIINMQASFRSATRGQAFRPAVASRKSFICHASTLRSVPVPVKSADGVDKGTQDLTVKVAEDSARGLVHRYMVMVQQNARRVRGVAGDKARTSRPHLQIHDCHWVAFCGASEQRRYGC